MVLNKKQTKNVDSAASFLRAMSLQPHITKAEDALFSDYVVIDEHDLPWSVQQLGCRAEYWFRRTPPKNGAEAAASIDGDLDHYMHLFALNRGILMTPFHNMALISPATEATDVDYHSAVFRDAVESII